MPGAVYALALLGLFWGFGLPGVEAAAMGLPLLLALAGGLALLLVVVAVAVDFNVGRPLAALARASEAPSPRLGPDEAPVAEEFARVDAGVRALHDKIGLQQGELRALAERRERAEQAFKLGEERLALAVGGANDGLWERDLDNAGLVLSAHWKGMLGYADKEFPDRIEAWREHVHPQDLEGVEAALAAHLAGDTPRFERQLRLRHKDGRYRWLLSRGSALRQPNGRASRMVGLDTDVTAIKRVGYVLEQVVEGTAGTWGEDFFRQLVRHFAAAMEVPCAFITECADLPPTRVRTLALWSAPRFLETLEYDLSGTLCDTVIREGRTCFRPRGLEARVPVEGGWQSYLGVPLSGRDGRVLGHLALLDTKEMSEALRVEPVFRVFAARAAAEIERKEATARPAQQVGRADAAAPRVLRS